jgi:hypothetical protein
MLLPCNIYPSTLSVPRLSIAIVCILVILGITEQTTRMHMGAKR